MDRGHRGADAGPLDFLAVPAMTVAGSLIGCKVGIRPKQRDDWTEVCNLWAMVVARPGLLKSPAVSEILRFLCSPGETAADDYALLANEYELDAEIYKKKRSTAAAKGPDCRPGAGRAGTAPLFHQRFHLRKTVRDFARQSVRHASASRRGCLTAAILDLEENSQPRGFYLTAWSGASGTTPTALGGVPFTSSTPVSRCLALRSRPPLANMYAAPQRAAAVMMG